LQKGAITLAEMIGATIPNKSLDSYYQQYIKTLPYEKVTYNPVAVKEQSIDEITNQVNSYLKSYYDSAIRNRQNEAMANRAAIDADATSRGMGASTFVTDAKSRQMNAAARDIANLRGQQVSTLAQQVQAQYQNYLANKLSADTTNAQNQAEIDKWNAQTRYALEELAYARAKEALAMAGSGGGSSRRSSPSVVKGDIEDDNSGVKWADQMSSYYSGVSDETRKKLANPASTGNPNTSSRSFVVHL
jgi:hypothetical protein